LSDRFNVSSGSPFEATIGFSRAVRVGDRVVVSGTAPVFPDGSCPESAGAQAKRCFEIIRRAEEVGAAHAKVFGEVRPAATMVVIAGLLDPRWKVEIEAEAQSTGTQSTGTRSGD
jgi:enamine deaminase RidA (YjgF/YER057c/UK114 family)